MTTKKVVTMGLVLMLALFAMLSIGFTQDMDKDKDMDHDMMMSSSPMEGTWMIESCTLADGTELKAPNVFGMLTLDDGMRNFNVYHKSPDGKIFSVSCISKYDINDSMWTETMIYQCIEDQANGVAPTYSTSEVTKSAPVTKDGMKFTVKPPFDPPVLVFEGDNMTATVKGQFTDVWKRVPDED